MDVPFANPLVFGVLWKRNSLKCGSLDYKDALTYEDEQTLEQINKLDKEIEEPQWKKKVGYGCATKQTCFTPMLTHSKHFYLISGTR